MYWRTVAGTPGDPDTHQRVLLLRRHHHLKQSHRVGQGEVEMLGEENMKALASIWKPCWCRDFAQSFRDLP